MNPTNPSAWNNPPPPGIDMDEDSKHSTVSSKSVTGSTNDTIDPYIKNPDYIKYKKSLSRERSTHHRRSRSRSHERKRSKSRDKRRRHRSRSRGRRRRSRSRSRGGRRHRRYSHSSSRSRSSSYDNERSRHKHKKRRSRRSRSRTHRHKSDRRTRRSKSHTPADLNDSLLDNDPSDTKEDEEPDVSKENAFKNDGSFMEMFKKMQEEKEKAEAEKSAAGSSEIRKPLPAFGKRRGGRVLKTGMVEKTKTQEDEDVGNAQDPWSIYLKEVKRYKEVCCDDDSKTRPLVK